MKRGHKLFDVTPDALNITDFKVSFRKGRVRTERTYPLHGLFE